MPQRIVRRGLGLVEVVVVLVIVGFLVLMVVSALPRQREASRVVECQGNLMQIGMALALYEQRGGLLPAVPPLTADEAKTTPSPLGSMLDELQIDSFREIKSSKERPAKRSDRAVGPRRVRGFLCPSDTLATGTLFTAPVSYRATTGDIPGGQHGPFWPGRTVSVSEIEAADGLAYTAAFAERLVGTKQDLRDPRNYALVPGPVVMSGCPEPSALQWRGDAGSFWPGAGWRSTLYNHALPPGPSHSCIADNGQSALIGASSAHLDRVHVLFLDGSVRPFTLRVDRKIWRGFGNINDRASVAPQSRSPDPPL